ncbi:hypothetical protein [Paenibacillus polymyxa]|uniref:Uncharacterized protein n=1 Tax=Paenibacillus polymyxa (strain SC2) TaxID=886882 RepID=E3EK87_PAEPS|nr:hypothetical protein [Paenibacillus polymyxa]ADO59414.1 hypothetical protein PPSC2_27985 [Paenibacillus polymyxa SC2]WPQ59745.1 hypothetical protein SKN87_26005 [Paenibacillus polymyxa]
MLRNIFGKLLGKKEEAVKIDMGSVIDALSRRRWDCEVVQPNVVVVKEKYRNHQRDFSRLFLNFMGDEVQFKDERGQQITKIPSSVKVESMYSVLKNITNVI